MASVRLSRRATKDLDAIPDKSATRILDALERLGKNPEGSARDVKALAGRKPWRRLRAGTYRVLFRIAQGGKVVLVGRVIDRKELERAIRTLPD